MAEATVLADGGLHDERSEDSKSSSSSRTSVKTDTMFSQMGGLEDLCEKYYTGREFLHKVAFVNLPSKKREIAKSNVHTLVIDFRRFRYYADLFIVFASEHTKVEFFEHQYNRLLNASARCKVLLDEQLEYFRGSEFAGFYEENKQDNLFHLGYPADLKWKTGVWVPRTVHERVKNFRKEKILDCTTLPTSGYAPRQPVKVDVHEEHIRIDTQKLYRPGAIVTEEPVRVEEPKLEVLSTKESTAKTKSVASTVVPDDKMTLFMHSLGFRFPLGHPLFCTKQADVSEYNNPLDTANNFLDKIKVANILSFVQKMISSTSHSERFSAIAALAESYGLLWRNWSQDAQDLFHLLADNTKTLVENVDLETGSFKTLSNHADETSNKDEALTENNHLKTVLGVLFPIFGIAASCFGMLPHMKPVSRLIKECADTCKNTGIIVKSVSDIRGVAEKVSDCLTGRVSEKDMLVNRISTLTKKFSDFDARITKEGASMLVDGTMTELDKEFNNVTELWYAISKSKVPLGNTHMAVKNLFEIQSRVKERWTNLIMSVTTRQEPVCLWLFGPPGVGKSRLVEHVVALLSKLHGRKLTTYARNACEQYWSGYCGHDVLVYDDFASATEAFDVKEFIPVKSCNPYAVQMAAIEEKGQAFTSKYVIICSNHSGLKGADGISNCDAIDRRRDLLVKIDDPEATRIRSTGVSVPRDHYKTNFSHLITIQYNPVINSDGSYAIIQRGITPVTIAALLYTRQKEYLSLYEETVARLDQQSKVAAKTDDDVEDNDDDEEGFDDQWQKVVDAYVSSVSIPSDIRKHKPKKTKEEQLDDIHLYPGARHPTVTVKPSDGQWRTKKMSSHGMVNQAKDTIRTGRHAFWFCGPPNTGKTCLAKNIQQSLQGEGRPCIVHDEFNANHESLVAAVDDVWDCYADKENPIVIIISNATDLKDNWTVNRDYQAFVRRLRKVVFSYKSLYRALAVVSGAQTFDQSKISIVINNPPDFEGKRIVHTTPAKLYVEFDAALEKKDVVVTTLTRVLPTTDHLSEQKICIPFLSSDYASYTIQGIADIIKNAPKSNVNGADYWTMYKICNEIKSSFGGNFETACLEINAKQVSVPHIDYALVFLDVILVISDEDGKLVLKKYVCDPEEIQDIAHEVSADFCRAERFRFMCTNIVDAALCLVKLVGVIGFGVSGIVHVSRVRHSGMYGVISNPYQSEGTWAENADEELPLTGSVKDALEFKEGDYGYVDNKPVAKSARKGTNVKGKEYCKDCHQPCSACTCYQVEGVYDGLAKIAKQVKQVQPDPLKFEGRGLRTITPSHRPTIAAPPSSSDPPAKNHVHQKLVIRGPGETKILDTGPVGKPKLVEVINEDAVIAVTLDNHGMSPDELKNCMQVDKQGSSLIPKIARNTIFVRGKNNGICLRGIMTHGHFGVTCAHFALAREDPLSVGDNFSVFTCDNENFEATIVSIHAKRDLCFFQLAKQSPQFSDIRQHFRKKCDNAALRGQYGALLYAMPDKFTNVQQIVLDDVVEMRVEGEKRFGQSYNGHYIGASYAPINSEKGSCGSIVMVLNSSIQRKIVAIHSAANTTHGLGAVVYQEDLMDLVSHANELFTCQPNYLRKDAPITENDIIVLSHQEIVPFSEDQIEEYGFYVALGYAGGADYVNHQHQPVKTRYWRSPLCLPGEDLFEPVALSMHDPRLPYEFKPYEEGLNNFNHWQSEMDIPLLDACIEELADWYATMVQAEQFNIRVLTMTEAINGVSDIPTSNPIQRDTSAGYPWKHHPGVSNKSTFFVFDESAGIWKIHDNEDGRQLKSAVDALIGHAKRGQRTAVVNIGTLKDEPRPIKRIKVEPATRAFWAAPLDKVLADRKYFHAACAALSAIHDKIPMKIGINPIAEGFNDLYYYHARISTVGWDADASGWDYSVPLCVMERVHRIFNRIYEYCDPNCTEQDQICRRMLFSTLVKPLVLYRETIVQLPGGNISGQPMTGQVNSFVNDIYTYYVWCKIFRDLKMQKMCCIEAYNEHVARSFYGDDLIITVSAAARPYFTPERYVEECAEFGLKLTPADKLSGDTITWKHLSQLEFLKRNFLPAVYPDGTPTGKYCGALLIKSFRKMLDWIQCKQGHDSWRDHDIARYNQCAVVSTIDTALVEAVNHGPVFFNNLRKHFMKKCAEYNIRVETWPTYAARFQLVWDSASEDQSALYVAKNIVTNEFDDQHELSNMSVDPAVVGEGGAPSMVKNGSANGNMSALQPLQDNTSADLPAHIHEGGNVPAVLYDRFILQQQGSWNSNQQAGTILATATISPFGCNAYVAYACRMFNAWVGDFLWTFLLAATGYNGGKIICFQLPPNLTTADLVGITDYTVFPHIIIDVKMADNSTVQGQDIRNVLFHWTSEESTSIDSTGGTVVWAVYIPLVNANGTACSVNWAISSKVGPKFAVAELVPLSTTTDQPSDISEWQILLPGPTIPQSEPITNAPISGFISWAYSTTPTLTIGQYGMVTGSGTPLGRAFQPLNLNNFYNDFTNNRIEAFGDSNTDRSRPATIAVSSSATNGSGGFAYNQPNSTTSNPVANGSIAGNTIFLANAAANGFTYGGNFRANIQGGMCQIAQVADPQNPAIVPVVQESFVQWTANVLSLTNTAPITPGTKTFYCCQTQQMIAALTGPLKDKLPAGMSVVFTVKNVATNLPIGYLRFSYPGYFSTNATTTNVIGQYDQVEFIPLQMIPMTQALPTPTPAMTANSTIVGTSSLMATQNQRIAFLEQQIALLMQDGVDGHYRPPDSDQDDD